MLLRRTECGWSLPTFGCDGGRHYGVANGMEAITNEKPGSPAGREGTSALWGMQPKNCNAEKKGGGGWGRHATSVWQVNWFSVGIGPASKATQ